MPMSELQALRKVLHYAKCHVYGVLPLNEHKPLEIVEQLILKVEKLQSGSPTDVKIAIQDVCLTQGFQIAATFEKSNVVEAIAEQMGCMKSKVDFDDAQFEAAITKAMLDKFPMKKLSDAIGELEELIAEELVENLFGELPVEKEDQP